MSPSCLVSNNSEVYGHKATGNSSFALCLYSLCILSHVNTLLTEKIKQSHIVCNNWSIQPLIHLHPKQIVWILNPFLSYFFFNIRRKTVVSGTNENSSKNYKPANTSHLCCEFHISKHHHHYQHYWPTMTISGSYKLL